MPGRQRQDFGTHVRIDADAGGALNGAYPVMYGAVGVLAGRSARR
jgi:hypothetical protein